MYSSDSEQPANIRLPLLYKFNISILFHWCFIYFSEAILVFCRFNKEFAFFNWGATYEWAYYLSNNSNT
jgi:hypothetical protein